MDEEYTIDPDEGVSEATKGEELNYNTSLRFNYSNNSPTFLEAVKKLMSEMKKNRLVQKQYTNAEKLEYHVNVIVHALYSTYLCDKKVFLAYSRDKNYFSFKNFRYRVPEDISYRNTIKVVNFLIDSAYVLNYPGYEDKDNPWHSRYSRMRAKKKLIDLIEKEGIPDLSQSHWNENEEIIIMRDRDDENEKYNVEYEDDENTILMRENLKKINRTIEKCKFYLTRHATKNANIILRRDPNKKPLDFTKKRLRRIFSNNSWEEGGRFYGGWWLQVPRVLRPFILFGDEDDYEISVELDFSGLHVNMAYALQGLDMPDEDPYTIEGYEGNEDLRDICKQVLLRIFNAEDEKSLLDSLRDRRKGKNDFTEDDVPKELGGFDGLIERIKQKHEPISEKYFHKGVGTYLQYLDSIIAERIMLKYIDFDYPVLPVHDSFITVLDGDITLENYMKDEFFNLLGKKCKIKPKLMTVEAWQKAPRLMAEIPYNPEYYGKHYETLKEEYLKRKKKNKR